MDGHCCPKITPAAEQKIADGGETGLVATQKTRIKPINGIRNTPLRSQLNSHHTSDILSLFFTIVYTLKLELETQSLKPETHVPNP